MSEKLTRRSALGVLGVGLAALTGGASRRSRCAAVTGRTGGTCDDALSLSGPAEVTAGGPNPKFVASNEADASVEVETGDWSLHRLTSDGWSAVASGPGGGVRTLEAGEQTAWVLLLGQRSDGDGESGGVGAFTTQTRYIGPVEAAAGEYAFVASGRGDDTTFDALARFAVVE